MFRGIFLLSFLFGVAVAGRSANQYIDNVLQTSFPKDLRDLGLNPARLSDFKVYFNRSMSESNFSSGNATGLDRIQRRGDCSGPTMFRGELTINCTLAIYPMVTSHRANLRYGRSTYQTRVQGQVSETIVYVVISGQPQNYIGSVKSYRVDRVSTVTPSFSQLPPDVNKYVRELQDGYRNHVSMELQNIFRQNYVYAIGRAIAYKPMPRQ